MKNIHYVAIAFVYILLSCSVAEKLKISVWMIGDSTMAIKSENRYPEMGWGMPFASLFEEGVTVKNHAKNGRSSKSFKDEGLWNEVYDNIQAGDYVLIQFGHNDQKIDNPDVGAPPADYEANLREYVRVVKEKNAHPILLTPIARRRFSKGKFYDSHGEYGSIACTLAKKMGIPCIDLNSATNDLLSNLGEENSASLFLHVEAGDVNYPNGITDNTHLNVLGAERIAELVVAALKRQNIPLGQRLK